MAKTNDKTKTQDSEHKSALDQTWFAFVMLGIIAALIVWLWLKVPQYLGEGLCPAKERGTYGDSFGSVNALFTGLAFAGLVFSILLQQRQIRLQRADFLSQLEAMEDSRKTVEEQNKLLAAQNQLMRGQTDVSLVELEAKAMQLDAQADELELGRMGSHMGDKPKDKLTTMRARADHLRMKVAELQKHIHKADRAIG